MSGFDLTVFDALGMNIGRAIFDPAVRVWLLAHSAETARGYVALAVGPAADGEITTDFERTYRDARGRLILNVAENAHLTAASLRDVVAVAIWETGDTDATVYDVVETEPPKDPESRVWKLFATRTAQTFEVPA